MAQNIKLNRISRDHHPVSRRDISRNALKVLYRLNDNGFIAYLAGGAVRDIIVGKKPKDFDVVTNARLDQVKRIFRNSRIIGRRFKLCHIYYHNECIEVSTFRDRAESSNQLHTQTTDDGLILRHNTYGTPEEDVLNRDFTCNSLFYDVSDFSVIDYLNSVKDLKAKKIVCIGDPVQRFREDPVRMLRAARFAATLDFKIDEATEAGIVAERACLEQASPARMFEEMRKIFLCGAAERLFDNLLRTGLLDQMFPEFSEKLQDHDGMVVWTRKVMKQLDRWVANGRTPPMELLYALVFGAYHEEMARQRADEFRTYREAIETVTKEHLFSLRDRVAIPRAISERLMRIMSVQPVLRERKPKQVRFLLGKPYLENALIYFKFYQSIHADDPEGPGWWLEKLRDYLSAEVESDEQEDLST